MLSLQKAHLLFTRGSPLSAEGKSRGSMCNFAVVCKFCSPSNVGERNLTKEGMALPSLPSASPFFVKGRCHGVAVTEGYAAGRKTKIFLPASNSPCRSLSGAAFCMMCTNLQHPSPAAHAAGAPLCEKRGAAGNASVSCIHSHAGGHRARVFALRTKTCEGHRVYITF